LSNPVRGSVDANSFRDEVDDRSGLDALSPRRSAQGNSFGIGIGDHTARIDEENRGFAPLNQRAPALFGLGVCCPRFGQLGNVGRDAADAEDFVVFVDERELRSPVGGDGSVRVRHPLNDDLPFPGLHDLRVEAAVFVGDLRVEKVVIGQADQSAFAHRGGLLERPICHHEAALDVFGEDEDVGVLEHAVEHPLLLT